MNKAAKLICSALIGVVLIGGLIAPAAAKYIGAEPRCPCCCRCGDAGTDCMGSPCADSGEGCGAQSCGLTGKGTCYSQPVVSAAGANGVGLDLSLNYQGARADGEIGSIDTGLGYGWSHSYRDLLFRQSRDLFRLDASCVVTKFQRAGRRGGLSSTRGHREEIVENPDGSIDVIDFVGGAVRRYEMIPGNPIRVGGSAPWMLVSITDRDNNVTELTYTGGLLTQVTGPYGRTIGFAYIDGRLQIITDPLGRTTSFAYDSAGNLKSITDAAGYTNRFSYTARHQFREHIDGNGNRWSYQYDSAGKLIGMQDSTGGVVFSGMSNNQNWATDPSVLLRNKQRVYEVDPVTEEAITSVRDGNGNLWRYHYNADGYITEVVAPDGATTTYEYDPDAEDIELMTDANGSVTRYEYDGSARRIKEIDAKGFETRYAYADANCPDLPTQTIYPNGSITEYDYDAACHRTKETRDLGGLNLVRQWSYNADGTLASETDPNGHTGFNEYDADGNLIKSTDAEGNITRYGYDNPEDPTDADYRKLGNRTCMVDGNGHVTVYRYDTLDRLTRETAKIRTVVDPGDPIAPACTTADADDIIIAEYEYDGNGNQTLVRRQSNTSEPREWQVTAYEYDDRDRLVKETQDPGGLDLMTAYSYDGNDNRTQTTDPLGNSTTFTYDVQNRRTNVIDALGNEIETNYDPVGNRLCEIDANGHHSVFVYDELNRLVSEARKMGDQNCDPADADDLVTQHFYDSGAAMSCDHDPSAPQCAGPTPGSGNIAYMIDPEQRHTHYKYDKLDRRWVTIRKVDPYVDTIGICDANDWCEYVKYDAADNVVTQLDANGNRTDMAYLDNDWLASETQDPGGLNLVTSYTYDGAGNVATVTNPRTNVVTNTHDERDLLVQVHDSIGRVASYDYDGIGNRILECDGNENCTGYAYDAVNRLVTVTDPMGEPTGHAYDPNGNLIETTDRKAQVTCHRYDAINRRILTVEKVGDSDCAVIDADDLWTQTDYDPVGNVIALSTARLGEPTACASGTPPDDCQTTSYVYDAADRLECETYADETTRCFVYDMAGNVIQRTDQLGQVTEYEYSDLYYLLLRDYQDVDEPDDRFEYDVGGRMTAALRDYPDLSAESDWLVTFDAYDAVNRLLRTTQDASSPVPMIVEYAYDTVAGTRGLIYPSGRICAEQADLRERLIDVTCDSFNAQYTYDLGNRIETRDYNNGITASYGYDANDWITSLVHSNGVGDFGYDYDTEGNKLYEDKAHDPTKSEAYAYDDVDRLIDYKVGNLVGSTVPVPSTQRQYDLDKVGNWDQFSIDGVVFNNTPNQMNEYDDFSTNGPGEIPDDLGLDINFADPLPTPPADGANWAHDKNGNRREDGERIYEYDLENRLVRVTRKSDGYGHAYRYDALGRRTLRLLNSTGPAPGFTARRHAYDDARLIEDQNAISALGDLLATYVYGNYVDEVLNMQRDLVSPTGPEDYYYHQNALWSVIALSDASGNVVERYAYTDYGCPTISDGAGVAVPPGAGGIAQSAIGNPYLFTGRRWDEESGLYYYRARYYDCESGRFLQRDSLLVLGELNAYRYVKGNPLLNIDPSGLRLVKGSEAYQHAFDWNNDGVAETIHPKWTWQYDFCVDHKKCMAQITVRVELNFDPGITTAQQAAAKKGFQRSTAKFNGFKVCCKSCKCKNGYLFSVDASWVNKSPDVTVHVQAGSTVDLGHWGTADPYVAAHELGHQLGLRDEYGKVGATNFGAVQAGKGLMNNANENALMPHVQSIFDKGKLWNDFETRNGIKRVCWLQKTSELCRKRI